MYGRRHHIGDRLPGVWEAVIQEFFERGSPGGLRFSINDGGARPDTVTLRLMQSAQLMETEA